MEEEKVPQL